MGEENKYVPEVLKSRGFYVAEYDYSCSVYFQGSLVFKLTRLERTHNWNLHGVLIGGQELLKKAKHFKKQAFLDRTTKYF